MQVKNALVLGVLHLHLRLQLLLALHLRVQARDALLELRLGVFVRGKYWYDFELKDESRPFKDISDSNRKQGAQSSGAEILDAVRRLLDRVHAGELAQPPQADALDSARAGWL